MRSAHVFLVAPFLTLNAGYVSAQQPSEITDTVHMPVAMEPSAEIYMNCLQKAFVAAQATAATDFPALTNGAIVECRQVRASAAADAVRRLEQQPSTADAVADVQKAFGDIDASFAKINLQVRDQLKKQSAQTAH